MKPLPARKLTKGDMLFAGRVTRRALVRLWGRDVMLYVGGVSFFALLAVFPALTILVGVYATVFTPEQAARQAANLAWMLPPDAQELFQNQVTRLTIASKPAVSLQGAFALIVGVYAAHRGVKALLAGLSFIHDEDKPRGFVGFNILALVVAVAAFALVAILSTSILTLRMLGRALGLGGLSHSWFSNEWTWSASSLAIGFCLLYRYGMSSVPVGWRASTIGGVTAALLSLGASVLSAFYVSSVVHLGATYGGVGAVVVFLIWLSWNVNAIFFGGALATEAELALHAPPAQPTADQLQAAQLLAATRNARLPAAVSSTESTRAPS